MRKLGDGFSQVSCSCHKYLYDSFRAYTILLGLSTAHVFDRLLTAYLRNDNDIQSLCNVDTANIIPDAKSALVEIAK